MKYSIKSKNILIEDRFGFVDAFILVKDDIIHDIVEVSYNMSLDFLQEFPLLEDYNDLYIFPGLIDINVHLHVDTEWEEIEYSTCLAAMGGVTSIVVQPLMMNEQYIDNESQNIKIRINTLSKQSKVDFACMAMLNQSTINQIETLYYQQGVLGFKIFLSNPFQSGINYLESREDFDRLIQSIKKFQETLLLKKAANSRQKFEDECINNKVQSQALQNFNFLIIFHTIKSPKKELSITSPFRLQNKKNRLCNIELEEMEGDAQLGELRSQRADTDKIVKQNVMLDFEADQISNEAFILNIDSDDEEQVCFNYKIKRSINMSAKDYRDKLINTFGFLTKEISEKIQYKLIARAEIKNYQREEDAGDSSGQMLQLHQVDQISSPDSNLVSPFVAKQKHNSIISQKKGSLIIDSIKKMSQDQLDNIESVVSIEDTIKEMNRETQQEKPAQQQQQLQIQQPQVFSQNQVQEKLKAQRQSQPIKLQNTGKIEREPEVIQYPSIPDHNLSPKLKKKFLEDEFCVQKSNEELEEEKDSIIGNSNQFLTNTDNTNNRSKNDELLEDDSRQESSNTNLKLLEQLDSVISSTHQSFREKDNLQLGSSNSQNQIELSNNILNEIYPRQPIPIDSDSCRQQLQQVQQCLQQVLQQQSQPPQLQLPQPQQQQQQSSPTLQLLRGSSEEKINEHIKLPNLFQDQLAESAGSDDFLSFKMKQSVNSFGVTNPNDNTAVVKETTVQRGSSPKNNNLILRIQNNKLFKDEKSQDSINQLDNPPMQSSLQQQNSMQTGSNNTENSIENISKYNQVAEMNSSSGHEFDVSPKKIRQKSVTIDYKKLGNRQPMLNIYGVDSYNCYNSQQITKTNTSSPQNKKSKKSLSISIKSTPLDKFRQLKLQQMSTSKFATELHNVTNHNHPDQDNPEKNPTSSVVDAQSQPSFLIRRVKSNISSYSPDKQQNVNLDYLTFLTYRPPYWEYFGLDSIYEQFQQLQKSEFPIKLLFSNIGNCNSIFRLSNIKRQLAVKNVHVYTDTCASYLYFHSNMVKVGETKFKAEPPIASKDNKDLLINAIDLKLIDSISSYHFHVPHEYKALPEGDFRKAFSGICSIGCTLQASWTSLFKRLKRQCKKYKEETLEEMNGRPEIQRKTQRILKNLGRTLTSKPAKMLGISHYKGSIQKGKLADFVVWDPFEVYQFTQIPDQYKYKDLHLFYNKKFYGEVKRTFLHGEIIYSSQLPEITFKIQRGKLMTRNGLVSNVNK